MDNLSRGIALVTIGRRDWNNNSVIRNRGIEAVSAKSTDAGLIEGSVVHQVLGPVAWLEDFKRTWAGGTGVLGSQSVTVDSVVVRDVGSPRPTDAFGGQG